MCEFSLKLMVVVNGIYGSLFCRKIEMLRELLPRRGMVFQMVMRIIKKYIMH